MAYLIYEGTTIRFYTSVPFTSISGSVVDPDIVTLNISVQGVVMTYTYTNGSGDPTGTIVRDSTGTYHADLLTTGYPGTWVWQWAGKSSSGHDTTHTNVVDEGEVIVSAASF